MKLKDDITLYPGMFEEPGIGFILVASSGIFMPQAAEFRFAYSEKRSVIELAELAVDVLKFLADKTKYGYYYNLYVDARNLYGEMQIKSGDVVDSTARDITNVRLLNGDNGV